MKTFSLNKGLAALWYPFIFGFYLISAPALARNTLRFSVLQQQASVTGIVTDGTLPLSGVSVSIKNQKNTVVTDFDGKFTIAVSPADILIFVFIGFKTIEIPVARRSVINVQMLEDVTTLQEVKINAGYYTVKESERTGSIARITAKDIEKQPVTNVLATMQGRMAGVNITQDTGVPGGGFNINIRGINSLRTNGNAPLYVIDGVPYSSDAIGSTQTSTVLPTSTSPLSNINPTDIESIEVLKDADATSIYGSRGANGVVLITTKKGKSGDTKFSASISGGTGQVTRFMNLMNTEQYLKMRKQAFVNDGITTYPSYAYDVNGAWDQNRYTNWQKKLIGGTASITNAQLSVSGGNEQTQFLIGGNFNSETTVFPGDFIYKKATMHASLNHQSENKRFRINFSLSYTKQKNDQPWTDLTHDAIFLAPNAPALYDSSGNLNWENGTFNNPLRNLEGKYLTDSGDLIANTVMSYDLVENLELKSNFGFTDLGFTESSTLPSTMYNPSYGIGSESSILFLNTTTRGSWIAEPQLKWKKTLGKSKFEILIGSTFQSQKNVRIVQKGTGFTSNTLIYNLAAAKNNLVFADEEAIYKYQAFFARLNFNWQKKYIINLTGRRDGSSRFGPGNQFANFGAIGGAWLFSDETWIKERLPFLSFGKLRASYGTTGSDQIGDYMFLDTYSTSGTIYEGTTGLTPTRL